MNGSPQALEDDEETLRRYATALANSVTAVLRSWVVAEVTKFWPSGAPDEIRQSASAAGQAAVEELGPKLTALLELDIDEQWTNPMAILRTAVEYPTAVLQEANMAVVERDSTAEQFHPDDVYDLTPGGFAAFGPKVGEAGLRWGAAKAHVHLRRRAARSSVDG